MSGGVLSELVAANNQLVLWHVHVWSFRCTCLRPLLQVWRSAAAQSRAWWSVILQSVAAVVLYPDPHVAPFTPPCAISSFVAQHVVQRRCQRYHMHVPTLPVAFKLLGCTLLHLRAVVRRW